MAAWLRLASRTAVALFPLVVILATPRLAGWQSVLPELYVPTKAEAAASATVLSDLTGQLSSLALATVVGSLIVLRSAAPLSRLQLLLAALVVAAAASSLYAGYRFQLGLAEQLALYRVDLDRLHDRLDWQATMLLAAVSLFLLQGVAQLDTRAKARPPE